MCTGIYESDDLRVTFTGQWRRTDYGVPGSERDEAENIDIEAATIAGVDLTAEDMPAKLWSALYDLHQNAEWH